ncbi:hypothetical protein QBC47DRAFT_378168, partial [Echria macrotheca]
MSHSRWVFASRPFLMRALALKCQNGDEDGTLLSNEPPLRSRPKELAISTRPPYLHFLSLWVAQHMRPPAPVESHTPPPSHVRQGAESKKTPSAAVAAR